MIIKESDSIIFQVHFVPQNANSVFWFIRSRVRITTNSLLPENPQKLNFAIHSQGFVSVKVSWKLIFLKNIIC